MSTARGNGTFLRGWPIKLNGAIQDTLPLIGPGHDAAIARVGGQTVVVASTTGGALAVYGADGSLIRGMEQSLFGLLSNATDRSGVPNLFEYARIGDVDGSGTLDIVKYGLTLGQLANLALAGQNAPYNHLIGAYDARTGLPLPAYPTITDDYQLLSHSSIGKVVSGSTNQILAGTGLGLLHAYDGLTGQDVAGFPKVTGGWLFAPPELSQDGRLGGVTREGFLFEWSIPDAPAYQPEWPTFRHDPPQTGNYDRDGTPPAAAVDLAGVRDGAGGVTLTWTAPGEDGLCQENPAERYLIHVDGVLLSEEDTPAPAVPGNAETLTLTGLAGVVHGVTVQAVDDAGNIAFPVSVVVGGRGRACGLGFEVAPILVGIFALRRRR